MANSTGIVSIYPTGRGHFALGSPDGEVLAPGRPIEIVLAGHQIAGIVQKSDLGDYLRVEDGSRCGLCACMCVVTTQKVEVVR